MKYGAGSALLREVMARSSSCCMVRSNTGSVAPAAAVCPSSAGAAGRARRRQRNKDFKDDMATVSVPQALDTGNVTLGVLPQSRAKARDPYSQEVYRVCDTTSVR